MGELYEEVVSAALKAASALQTVVGLITSTSKKQPHLVGKLQPCIKETKKALRVAELIRDEEGLQTSGVVAGIASLQAIGEALQKDLLSLKCGKTPDKNSITKLADQLRADRKNLIKQITIASVGLTKNDGTIMIDLDVVKSADDAIKTTLGDDHELEISIFMAKLNVKADTQGRVRLTQSQYEEWNEHQIKTAHPETQNLAPASRTRILCNSLARDQSIQILGPVAVDIWSDIAFVKIDGLVSMGQSIQFGYPVTMEVFKAAMDRQDKLIAASYGRE